MNEIEVGANASTEQTPWLYQLIVEACAAYPQTTDANTLWLAASLGFYPNMAATEQLQACCLTARSWIEQEPDYSFVAAALLASQLHFEVLGEYLAAPAVAPRYASAFVDYIQAGIAQGLLDPKLASFDLARLAAAIVPERDALLSYPGLQTLYDRYFIQWQGLRRELPQIFWMRVAMGLALNEPDRETQTLRFYEVLSQFHFTSATPTLFNAATTHPQLSSCYLSTVGDDLEAIFGAISDNAMLSKWAGGLGNDWTPVRALGAPIHGTNGVSQGVIPFLKIVNDTAIAVNQGGKRKGAVCAYLEAWHADLEDFLDLRKPTGDERRRTHDMHTALWIPDLLMERVLSNGSWTLFSPDEVPDLHDLYGQAFAVRYAEYEALAAQGLMRSARQVEAVALWRKILTRLFETGHPWITWKDAANVRSPQDHVGVIHSSNLCTEILLNTSADEIAVCNLGSINLAAHIRDGSLDLEKLRTTVTTAVRMLDNVIDINFYPRPQAAQANARHRPIGLGLMGFQDALYALKISYASQAAVEFSDRSMESIAYFAVAASIELARERGAYPSFRGSKWDRGMLPIDSLALLAEQRDTKPELDHSSHYDWQPLRQVLAQYGIRNSNLLAIAPTATIANIVGTSQSIEPTYRHLYVKSNLSGDFTTVNRALVDALKARGLWDADLLAELKYYDGAISQIERVPAELKAQFLTAFEIAPEWLIACAARRQKWIDMGQSLNLYVAETSGKRLNEIYLTAWRMGLKTTYYLRTLAATQIEKSTLDINRFGVQPRWMRNRSESASVLSDNVCPIDDPSCEACE